MTGIVLVNVATMTWATNMVLGRWLRDYAGPLTLAAARYTIACLLFALLLISLGLRLRVLKSTTARGEATA